MDYREEIQKNREYWETVLGGEICEKLMTEKIYEKETEIFQKEANELESLFEKLCQEKKGWDAYPAKGTFGNFYRFFGRLAVVYAGKYEMIHEDKLKNTVLFNFYSSAAWIPIRVLIEDIHSCKENGMLRGKDSGEEYQDYQERFLNDQGYIRKLCGKYPEMKRLLFLRIITITRQIHQIISGVEEDIGILQEQFFPENPFKKIERIECGISDTHRGGQTVARVYLDNGKSLIYKPRNLEKDRYFMELYGLFCQSAYISFENIRILAREDFGWESYVEERPCRSEGEVKRYYRRIGILLFLCRLMDVSDIHGENIIAYGEYPMPIDLETLPGSYERGEYENADQMIREEMKHSVLSVGILPVMIWGENGEGIILNALNRGGAAKTPFRVPVIREQESSAIHIAYQQGSAELPGSMPIYQGRRTEPATYAGEIQEGFQNAYRFFLKEGRQLTIRFEALFSGKSRYLIRHTQQYQMYLQTSFYPEFLACRGRRKLFLHILDKNQRDERLAAQEREAVYQMDIPVFYQEGSRERWREKLRCLGEDDLKRQLSLIGLSLGLLEERKYVRKKAGCPGDSKDTGIWKERVGIQVRRIADSICAMALTMGDDIGFYGPRIEEDGNFKIGPVDIYLYEGICGIAVFLAAVIREYPTEKYCHIFDLTIRKLQCYTEGSKGKIPDKEMGYTGAFLGEGSVVFTYLLLYEITGEKEFLAWAKRHAEIVEGIWEMEQSMDYLTGLSGAVIVFLKLFRLSGKKRYLETAVRMGERIWEGCVTAGSGAGWCVIRGNGPLVGMAHGNSGLILAFSHLLELTWDGRYEERIRKLLEYEDSLYENGNWKDLRHPGGLRLCNNAWCHGAAGILLSRIKGAKYGSQNIAEQMGHDLECCKKVFLEEEEPEELCLCHGMAGNYLALGQYLRSEKDRALEKERRALSERILARLEREDISFKEKYNPALMTGISGIGLALCGDSFGVDLL